MNIDFFSGVYGTESRNWMSGVGNAKLAAQDSGGHASLIVGNA